MKRLTVFLLSLAATLAAVALLWLNLAPEADVARALLALERYRAGMSAGTIEAGGLRIAYLEGGEGEPIVLLHGMGADKYHWTRVAPYLTPRFRVIAVDLPGFGDSSRDSERPHTVAAQVENVREIVRALGLSSFHLGGNSMGAFIAAEYAVAHPREVRTLWLLAPGGVGEGPKGELADIGPGEHVPLFARSVPELENVAAWVTSRPPYVPGAVKRALAARAAADYALHVKIFHEINAEWRARPLEETVAGLPTPTRIVWGEEDRVLPATDAARLAEAMPRASVLLLPGVGHLPMLEAPRAVAEDYLAFFTGGRER